MKKQTPTVHAVPRYDRKCCVCEQVPCVDFVDTKGKVHSRKDLCGVCCFGTAKALDPDCWDEL